MSNMSFHVHSPAVQSSKFKSGCMILFGLPFVLTGLLSVIAGVKQALEPAPVLQDILVPSIFGLIFGGVGLGIMYGGRYIAREMAKKESLKQQYPDRPWMWREDWAAGRIADSAGGTAIALWIFCIVWNSISFPAAFLVFRTENAKENPAIYFVLLFPLVGLLILWAAVHALLQKRRFGTSWFALTSNPGVVGRQLRGTIDTNFQQAPDNGVVLRLTCVKREVRRSGNKTSTSERTIWEETDQLLPASLQVGMEGLRIPVSFDIPVDALPTDDSDSANQIIWRLQANADIPGVDFSKHFDVPVFVTGEAPLSEEEREAVRDRHRQKVRGYAPPTNSKIVITKLDNGATDFFFPARRTGGWIQGVIFLLFWFGIVYAMFHYGIPIVFPIVMGLFGLIVLLVIVVLLFHSTRVVVDRSALTITHKILMWEHKRSLAAGEVSDVTTKVSGQGAKDLMYEVTVKAQSGKAHSAGGYIRDKREAEWIAEKIRTTLKGI